MSHKLRDPELPEVEVRKKITYPWVYDCTFRDSLWNQDTLSFEDFARCEFEAKLKDGRWRHFFVSGIINKLDREMDIMKRVNGALEYAMAQSVITDHGVDYEITELRSVIVPEDKKKLLLKNRIINILEHHDDVEDEAMIQQILKGGVGARQGPTGGKV